MNHVTDRRSGTIGWVITSRSAARAAIAPPGRRADGADPPHPDPEHPDAHHPDPHHPDPPRASRRPRLDERVLVVRAQEGDPRAFEQLVRRHQQSMFAVALRIVANRADAEDATQNAFLAVWRRLPDFHHDATFSTWLYRVITNHALNQVRSRARTDGQLDMDSLRCGLQPVASDPDPQQYGQASALVRDLRAALAALPDELRVCWLLREVDNCSYEDVAAIAGISPGTARGRIYRARRRLAGAMVSWR